MRYLYHFGLEGIVRIKHSKTVSANDKFQIEHDTIIHILSTLFKDKMYNMFIVAKRIRPLDTFFE